MAVRTGLEPATSCVTGRHSNQLNYRTRLRGQDLNLRPSGYEPDELPNCSTPRRDSQPTDTRPHHQLAASSNVSTTNPNNRAASTVSATRQFGASRTTTSR